MFRCREVVGWSVREKVGGFVLWLCVGIVLHVVRGVYRLEERVFRRVRVFRLASGCNEAHV